MQLLKDLKERILYLDGGMGTLLQSAGLQPGELPERWNLQHPGIITKIHEDYFRAGSNIVCANTFGANSLKFSKDELEEIISAAFQNAKAARAGLQNREHKYIALDIGPTGRLLNPYGDLDFEKAVEIFSEVVRLGEKYGADLVFIETMNDSYETKAALLAAKENTKLPVFVSNAYGADGKLMTGATPECMVALLEGMHADAIGVNCSLGPQALLPVVSEYLKYASVPVLIKPNAGLPKSENSRTFYDVSPKAFAESMSEAVRMGARLCGGCCGTTPEYIKALCNQTADINPVPTEEKNYTLASSYSAAVDFNEGPVIIGERINPTGKKRFKEALKSGDVSYILKEGLHEEEVGAAVLDVNVGLPGIDEKAWLLRVVKELQAVTALPLQIDTSNPQAMAAALRIYNGKAVVNSVNGTAESMETIFPLVQKYGGLIVALTLDENGIPKTAAQRVAIAEKILRTAQKYSIPKKDILFDTLAMTASADPEAPTETLKALKIIRQALGCHTLLGVSNVSFGLPQRDGINSAFLAMAFQNGLSAAIVNPNSDIMMRTYYAFKALSGRDENCLSYIDFCNRHPETATVRTTAAEQSAKALGAAADSTQQSALFTAITKGLKDEAECLTAALLKSREALEIINEDIIPALDVVGKGFEQKTIFLPGLLMSAEAASAAFEQIKAQTAGHESAEPKADFVLATVKGDVHDIGKNIVGLLMSNYGFTVHDLGKDVDPEEILKKTVELHAPIVGLSALMTTTVPAMEETVKLLRKEAPWAKIIVGGAVLTADYAKKIGADYYAADAMAAVRCAEEIMAAAQK